MRIKNYSGLLFGLALFGTSCISPPEDFPSVPEIEFSSLVYAPTPSQDSLILTIKFKDAEGDLGLSATEINPPFNPFNFRRDGANNLITYSRRPANAPTYNPVDWVINPIVNNNTIRDTLWVEQNENQYNIFVRFFIKRNGRFTEFRWQDPPFFTTFNGRFPRVLTTEEGQPVEGSISYRMLSSGWESIFRNDTLRIDVQIQDRALNRSNEVSSPELTLRQITRN
ncbi:MAG: hypothetical protein ACK4SF_13930 [Algoriphagus aquaeductus]|jgi:hypothetical protein|uniref:Lipoprotein n=1 Tax=Algoriphagus aquaeductus TaxID=475299 RepID=A0A326RT64_9BACT|nr:MULTISPECIES: hypothetical protein [Algoriphagus]PZV83897.1 hypothetical protein CLV31_105123 [Algoriphagus aquaeductus]